MISSLMAFQSGGASGTTGEDASVGTRVVAGEIAGSCCGMSGSERMTAAVGLSILLRSRGAVTPDEKNNRSGLVGNYRSATLTRVIKGNAGCETGEYRSEAFRQLTCIDLFRGREQCEDAYVVDDERPPIPRVREEPSRALELL